MAIPGYSTYTCPDTGKTYVQECDTGEVIVWNSSDTNSPRFVQEYPATAGEAFKYGGSTVIADAAKEAILKNAFFNEKEEETMGIGEAVQSGATLWEVAAIEVPTVKQEEAGEEPTLVLMPIAVIADSREQAIAKACAMNAIQVTTRTKVFCRPFGG